MWSKITGKTDTSSQHGRRKDQRRRTGSLASSHASRNPTRLEDRSDYPPTLSSRGTTYPPPPSSASIASYATAPDRRSTIDHDVRSERTAVYDDREDDDARSARTDGRRDDESRSERSSKHRERSTSRDRKRDRDDTGREHKKKGKKDTKDGKERRDKDESSKKTTTHKSRARASSKASDSIVDEPVRPRAADSLQRGDSYTSQPASHPFKYAAVDSAPTTPGERLDAQVGSQSPRQNPSQYAGAYRPSRGEATSYYGDQGESVNYQPGVRVEDPDMLINPHTHLIAPSAVPMPPEETGHGSAADFYSGTFDVGVGENPPSKPPRPQSMPGSFEPDAPPKPTRKTSKTEKVHKLSSAASAAGSAALGYALGKHSSHNVSSRIEESVEHYTSSSGKISGRYSTSSSMPTTGDPVPATSQPDRPGENYISGNNPRHHSTSYSMPPSADYVPVTSQSSRPGLTQSYSTPVGGAHVPIASQSGKPGKSSSHSTAGLYAGAAGLAAGYGLHELHTSHHHSPALPPRPSQNGNHGSQGLAHAALGMHHRQTGPVSKFVDWWKDHEDVRKMEEYTEYIGVCRDCFDPREPPSMAPRKHHYHHHHKRRSNGSLRSNRVDKESRYHYSSSDDDGKRNSHSWVAKGLAGYGLAKVGKALWWQNQDFDDTYSAKSGRRYRSSRSSTGRRSRSASRDRTSTTSRGVIRHRSNSRDSRTSRSYSKTTKDYKIVHHHGHSRSRSRDRKSGLFSAAAGAALGASLAARSKERSRSRSKSPSREYVIKKSYVGKPRSSGSALGVEDDRRFSSRHSTTSSYVENKSHRSSNQSSTGVFGMFTGTASPSDRRKTHSKKKKGFFTFANGSSSSTDSGLVYGGSPELRRRSSELRRNGSHKKRRNSDDKLNSTLLGLGATAAALAAVQGRRDEKARNKHRPSPEVFAVRESKSRKHLDKRHHMPGSYDISSSEDGEWEEVSDAEDDSASIDTGLAFGDYAQSIKSRKSVDSLRSDGSGTNKWDWRWGSKKDKRKRTSTESLKNGTYVDGRSSVSSVPALQTVFPVPTSDPTMFDAAGRSSSIPSTPQVPYGHPLVTSRPEPLPLQQPQPIMPVSNSIYSNQAPGPSYMAPSGPPVFSSSRPPLVNFRNSSDYFRAEERPTSSPRREEPSTPTSSWKRDATIVGIAAATGAAIATAHSHASSKAGSSSPSQSMASRRVSSPSSVRFDLTKEQEEKEDRQRRKDLRKKEEERAERERLRRLEEEASLKESKKREEAEKLAAIKRDAEEMQARAREKRERERRAYAASEMERETRRIQKEREAMALQAAELERAARDEAERLRQESEAATRQRERLEREILEADLRRERDRAEAEERQPSEYEYDVESRERQLQQREADVVDPDEWSSWKEPAAAAAAVGVAAGAAAAAGLAYRSKNDQEEAPQDDSPRGGRVRYDDDHINEEPAFDPDYFRKKDRARPSSRDRESDIVRRAASKVLADFDDDSAKVLADLEERYKEPQRRQSMAEFFSPSELSDRKTSISRDYFGPNADADVQTSFNVPRIVTVEPPYAPEYSFTATHDDEDAHRYNVIPRLNLIEPTPPVSVASSIRGDRSHPTSPSMPAHREPIKTVEEEVEPEDDKQPKRPGVTWGVDETHYFDTPTPDSVREHFVSDQDFRRSALEEWTRRKEHEQEDHKRERQDHDEIVVEHDSPSFPGKRTSYRASPERSYAEAELPPKPELNRKPKSRSSDDDSPVEEIKRFEDDGREIIEATSPERTPVVLTPTEQRSQFYQSPFFETVSDFTTAFDVSPTESASGFVQELGLDEQPDVSERGMPGAWGFVEDDVASNPFSDTRVVEELPSPTEPQRKDPDLQPKVEEVEDQVFEKPFSKREQRKKDKAAKRASLGHDDSPSAASTPKDEPVQEELWEDTSSSKSKKKKKKSRDSFGADTGSASTSVASTPVAEEPAAEALWADVPLSKKDKRKKKEREREEKRMERERGPKDMEPSTTSTSGSQTPSASGLDIAADAARGMGYAAAAGVLAHAMTGSKHKEKQPEEPRGREQISRQPPYPTEVPNIGFNQTPGSYGSEGEHTPSGTFTSTAPYIPSRAFDDVEELADAKKPGKKGKRRSKYGSPSPGSPLRTEVAFDDYVGMDAAAAATAALPPDSNAGAYQTSDFAEAVNAPLPMDDASVSSRESEKESRRRRQYVFDEPEEAGVPLFACREREADNERNSVFSYRDDWKEHRRGSRQDSEGGPREDGDARSTVSDERVVDEQARRKHRHHRRRESERSDSTRDADTRSVVSEGRYDEEGHRKHKHRKHRSAGVDRDDVGAVVAEFRDDEDDDLRRKHKHKKRVEVEPTIPERPKSDPGVEDASEDRRKHKRRSKRESERGDDEDTASVVSGPAKYNEKEKEKRSSLFSSLFGRSSKESVASRESKDDRSIDDEERKHRRRKHRSSTLQSSYASDPEDDGVSNTTASRRHRSSSSSSRREKESARDDSGMDYNSSHQRKHKHDKVFDYDPSSRVAASPFSASTNVGDESLSLSPASDLAGDSPFPTTVEDDDGVGHVYDEGRQSFLSRSSSRLSYVDGAVEDILSTGSKQIYTSTPPTAGTAAAPSADLSNPFSSQQSPHVASQTGDEKSFLFRRARGPEAPASLTSPPLPINTSVEHAAQQPPLSLASHQHPPTTAASLLSLGGNENDPEFDEAFPIFTALPPSRPGSPTAIVPAAVDESTVTSPPPSLGINTKALRQVESPAQGMRSPSATAIPLRFRIGASRNVSGGTSAVQSPVEPHHNSGAWDEHLQHQDLGFSPSASPLQDRYYAQAPWQQYHEFAASSPIPTPMPTPTHSRHATSSPMPSPTAIPNPFFRSRPSSMHMHKKTPSAGVVSTGKEFRPLYLVESVRGRSKSSPVGIRGKERWTAAEQAWTEARGDRWDDVAVEDLPALPGSRRGSEASVQSARGANDEPEGDAAVKDVKEVAQPEMVEIPRDPPEHPHAETSAPTSTNVFDFLVQDDDDDGPTGTTSAQEPSIEQTPRAPASKKSSPASSLSGGLLNRTSSKKSKKGKKAKKLGTASPLLSSSPPPRDPELDLAWRERDTADAVAGWFEGDDTLAGESVADAAKVPGESIMKKEEEASKEGHVPPALLTRDSKGKGKGKAKGKSKAKSKKGPQDKSKSEDQNDDDAQREAGDQNLSETPTPGAATPLEAQDPSRSASGFDRDVDRDLWREELELHRSGNERSRSRSPRAPLEPQEVVEGQQLSASRGLGETPHIETEEQGSGTPRDEPIVQPLDQDSSLVKAPVDVFAYLEREDEPNVPLASPSAPVLESTSVQAPINAEPDLISSTREQHKSSDVRDKHQDDAAAVGSGLAAATGAVLAAHGQEQQQTSALLEAEPIVEEPLTAEPTTPADDSDLNPVLAPAKVSKKDKRKAKKKIKLLRGQSNAEITTVRAPSATPAAPKGPEEETAGSLVPESEPTPPVGDESSLWKTTSGDEGKGLDERAATPALFEESTGRNKVEPRGVSDDLDAAQPQSLEPDMLQETGPSLNELQEQRLVSGDFDSAATPGEEASQLHQMVHAQRQPSPERKHGLSRHEIDGDAQSIPTDQHESPDDEAFSTPLPISPPSSPPTLSITSAVMESIFSATEQAYHPRDLAELDERGELGRDNVANMPLPEFGEDEMRVQNEESWMEGEQSRGLEMVGKSDVKTASTSGHTQREDQSSDSQGQVKTASTVKPQKIPIPPNYLEQPIVQELASIGHSPTPSSASVATPPAAGNIATPVAITPGKKGKKRSSSVAAVTAAPSAPLPTLATPPPVQKARKRGESRVKEEFIPSLEETVGPVPMAEPVSARSLSLPVEQVAGPVPTSEPVSSRPLPFPVEEEEAGASTPEPEPETLGSGFNTPPIHVLEMGQAVRVEVTSPMEKPTSVIVGQAVPVPVRAERPVPVSLQREDDGIPDRDGSFESVGFGGQEGSTEEGMKRDRDVAAAKEQLEALGVGAPLEVVMEDLAEANVEKEQEQDRRHNEEDKSAQATYPDALAHESIEPSDKPSETPSIETQEPSAFPTEQRVEPEEAGDDKWAVSTSKKKGKKGKAKKGKQTSAPSTPQHVELVSAPHVLSSEPKQELPAYASFEESREQPIGEEDTSATVAVEPEGAGENEWAAPVGKKAKKVKKGKRASLLSSPPLKPEAESVEPSQDLKLGEPAKEPSVSLEPDPPIEEVLEQPAAKQESEATSSSTLPTEATGEDEWSVPSAKKKGKKGKKGKRMSLPSSPAPEPVASVPGPEAVEPVQEFTFDGQIEGPASQFAAQDAADDVQKQPQTEGTSVAPADAGVEAGEVEWAAPVRKKSKKGRKGKAVEVAPDSMPGDPGTSLEAGSRMQPASLVEPAVESESVKTVFDVPLDSQVVERKEEAPVATDIPPAQDTFQNEQISAAQPEETGDDEWALSSGKKKGKKGKKGKRASLPISPPAEPEPTVKPVSDSLGTVQGPVLPEEETAIRDQASEMPGGQLVSGQEGMPTEAGEDEWALPGKKKKGKRGKRASVPWSGALGSEVPGESSPVDLSHTSMEASVETSEPSAPIGMDLGEDQLRADQTGESGPFPATAMPPTQESHGSEITSQPLGEPTLQENVEAATSPREETREWAIPKKKKKGKKARLSLPSTPPVLEDTEGQIESSEEQFIDPNDVLKYASAASVESEPPAPTSKPMDNQPQEFHQDPVLSEAEPQKSPSSHVEEFIDPSDVLKYAAASQAGQERPLDEKKRAAEFDDPRPTFTAEDAPHQRSASPVAEQIVDQHSIAEPSTQADDSDLNPVLAPAKVSKKDKKRAKKKNKLQASLADYAPLDSSQNATDTEPLLAREPLAEPSNAPPAETEGAQPQSPQVPATTAAAEDDWTVPAKKSKKEKRKSKKNRGAASPPMPPHEGDLMTGVEYFSPTEETERAAHYGPTTFGLTRDAAASAPERSSRGKALDMSEAGVVSDAESPAPRETLVEISKRDRRVEPRSSELEGTGKRKVDPFSEGPVRESPIPHETSGSSFVQDQAINEPQVVKSRPMTPDERAKSPNRDIDFAATVAAGLEGAGLDANLVLNDPRFSERKSPPRSTGEADPEEAFIPARPRKKRSADAKSPPAEQSKTTSISGEKLPGQDAAFDAALSSVLADPTFNRRTPSPDSAKEAVSDEFFPFQKRSKKKKSKTPASEEKLRATQERVEDSKAPVHNSTGTRFATPGDNEPFSDPGTPFEEHMTEYFPVGTAHPTPIHVPPPPPLPNLGEYEQREKPKREGLGSMGMRSSSSKSWAEQMEEEEENKASSLEEKERVVGKGGKAAAVGAAVAGAAGVAALGHRGDRDWEEENEASGSKSDAYMASSQGGAPKKVEESQITPEERPFSPLTPGKIAHLFPRLERVKRRVPSPRNGFEQSVPERRPSPVKQDNHAVRLTQPIQSDWNNLVRDSAVTMNDTPPLGPLGVDTYHDAGRDSGYHDDSRRESAHGAGQLRDPVPEMASHRVEGPAPTSNPQDNAAASSPTESITTTKQRSSALFQSPGSTNEAPADSQGAAEAHGPGSTAPPFPARVTDPITVRAENNQPYVSIFGDGVPMSAEKPPPSSTPPRMRSPQPLDTIREHSPEESPLAKKSRPLSDVGMPEHGLKSMRRSDTEDMEASPRLPSDDHGPPKRIWSGKQPEKGTGRARGASVGSDVAVLSGRRSPSGQSDLAAASKGEFGSILARIKTPDMLSPAGSTLSQRSATPPLRRINRAMSGDLRTASLVAEAEAKALTRSTAQAASAPSATTAASAGPSTYDRVHDKGKAKAMDEQYEGWGDAPDTPRSPSRPPSIRKRQSLHIMDLETRLDQLVSENRLLQDARARAEDHQRDSTHRQIAEAVQARDEELHAKDAEIASISQTLTDLRQEVARLTEVNASLAAANKNLTEDTNQRYATLQVETQQAQEQYEQTTADLDLLQQQYRHLQAGVEGAVRDEVDHRLREKEAEIARLHGELADATEQIKTLQQQILGSKQGETFLKFRDEDYFDQACQQLCQHVQQWVLRFSKFSDTRACRLSSEVRDEKIETRLDNAILDGTDVDMLLADRVRRRDVFMSVVMTMIWEYIFTRYLFGMDREQRQKLKALEKQLSEVGPPRAVAQWRAITLTLLSRRDNFEYQRSQDTEAVVQEIFNTLSALLPPPSNLVDKVLDSLRNVMRLAVDLSIEMRTQRAEYIMLPPLQPEYDQHGNLLRKVHFKASLMNERSGETSSNAELEAAHAVVKIVLFPLVVKKGDDLGDGEDEIVVCPAQVLTAKTSRDRKVVRVLSGAMEIDDRRSAGNASRASALPADEGAAAAAARSVVDLEGGF